MRSVFIAIGLIALAALLAYALLLLGIAVRPRFLSPRR